ncbi:MAG: hypothetical protein QOH93_1360 [Chloroflexia bacterium]|jgi:predicted ferric reductase|nr:hypothetical protein [Chloroflexia bacterium]
MEANQYNRQSNNDGAEQTRRLSVVYAPYDQQATGSPVQVSHVSPSPEARPQQWGNLAVIAAAIAGALAALLVLPAWLPTLANSITGADPKFYWYLSRASALVAYVLLWVSMSSGLLISNKMARRWPGGANAFDLHQFTSLLGLAFALFHALILLGERYIGYSLVELLVPFAGTSYRPLWVGIGQVSFYISIVVSFTFYIRRQIGTKAWRLIHFLSYGTFGMAMLHGLLSGTDSANPWLLWMYWLTSLSLLALTAYRVALAKRPVSSRPSLIKS